MSVLDPKDGYYVLINTFTVDPGGAERLLDLLNKASEDVLRHKPGFVSANLHVSEDGTRVANYAQWASREQYEAIMKDPVVQQHLKDAAAAAVSFDPIFYELRDSVSA